MKRLLLLLVFFLVIPVTQSRPCFIEVEPRIFNVLNNKSDYFSITIFNLENLNMSINLTSNESVIKFLNTGQLSIMLPANSTYRIPINITTPETANTSFLLNTEKCFQKYDVEVHIPKKYRKCWIKTHMRDWKTGEPQPCFFDVILIFMIVTICCIPIIFFLVWLVGNVTRRE